MVNARLRPLTNQHGTRTVVVGAGVAGLTAAHYLIRRGHSEVTVVESLPAIPSSGHTVAVAPFAVDILSSLDVDVRAAATDRGESRNGSGLLAFRHKLYEVLSEGLPDGAIRYGWKVGARQTDKSVLSFENGKALPYDVVLFADGRNSVGRRIVASGNSLRETDVLVAQGIGPTAKVPQMGTVASWRPRGVNVVLFDIGGGETEWYCCMHRPQSDIRAVVGRQIPGGFVSTDKTPVGSQAWFKAAMRQLESPYVPLIEESPGISFAAPGAMDVPDKAIYQFGDGACGLIGDAFFQPWFWTQSGTSEAIRHAILIAGCLPTSMSGDPFAALQKGDVSQAEEVMIGAAKQRQGIGELGLLGLTKNGYAQVTPPPFPLNGRFC